ncbi:MAG: hypothetical protein ACYC3X_24870 [Pirellulaceae bacterium]
MHALSIRLPLLLVTLCWLPGTAGALSSRVFAQALPTKPPGFPIPAGAPQAANPRAHELWCAEQPVPKAAEIPRVKGVEFAVIQPRVPEQDGYNRIDGDIAPDRT